jgi:hypothetical protein
VSRRPINSAGVGLCFGSGSPSRRLVSHYTPAGIIGAGGSPRRLPQQ